MRFSRLASTTSRDKPRAVHSRGHELLQRGGFIRPLSQGLYTILPLGMRVLHKLSNLVRSEMEALDGQEVQIPLVNPMELWQRSGRAELFGDEMISFRDRSGKRLVLAPTHEEAAVDLVKSMVHSYRDLPIFLYQVQTKYRNEMKPRGGLLRTRELIMKDAYSFHRSFTELNNFLPRVFNAYQRIFASCNVPCITAEAANGVMMGERSFEFVMPFEAGDDVVVTCGGCGYTANREVAVGTIESRPEPPLPVERVETGAASSMRELAAVLGVPLRRLGKSMAYTAGDTLILAIVRGDQEVSAEKLAHAVDAPVVSVANREQLELIGLDPSAIGPVDLPLDLLGLDVSVKLIVDPVVALTPNLTFGSNESGYRLKNVNFLRDFDGDKVVDIARVVPGADCVRCGTPLVEQRVIELGHIFRIGGYYSRKLRLTLSDSTKRTFHPYLGAYGIGISRLLAAVAEANNDKRGLAWPAHLAPFYVFLMGIGRSPHVKRILEEIHDDLGDVALLDDRGVSISTKFRDADLIGVPFRIIVSTLTVDTGSVELLARGSSKVRKLHLSEVRVELDRMTGGFV
ncbi:MAG: proline--tRNA ligase [Spirochaetales bacterium]